MQNVSKLPTRRFSLPARSGADAALAPDATPEGQALRVAVVHSDAAVAARLCGSLNAHRHRVLVFSQAHGLVSAVEGGDEIGVAFLGAADLVMVRAQIGDRVMLMVQVGGSPDPAADASLPARYTAAELRTCLTLLEKMHRLSITERLLEDRVDALRQALSLDLELPLLTLTQLTQRMLNVESLSPTVRAEIEAIAGAAAGARQRLDTLRAADGGEPIPLPTPQMRPMSARAVIGEVLPLAGLHHTAVHWDPEDGDPIVRVDPGLFQQALETLLADARRRTEGTGRLSVTVTPEMTMRVELSGVQAPTEPAMAACEAILAAHQGRAEIIWERGGSQSPVVRLTWPKVVEVRPAELHQAPTPPPEERLNIWMVDDETMQRRASERLFSHLRHDVRLFDRGAELVEALPDATRLPDLILADNDMPGMSGLEVLRRVRTLSPGAARVLYTAHAPGPAVVDAFNHGTVQRCVHKSDGIPALEAILRQIMAERRADGRGATVQAEEDRLRIDLDDLIAQRRVTLFVQPLYDAQTGAWVACEALMRSRHPSFKGPIEILDTAKHFDRQLELQRLLAVLSRDIRDQLPPDVTLFVNVDSAILRSVKRLDDTLSPLYPVSRGIVLELTERARLSHEPGWEMVVQRMRDLGFRIALDDVGAGYNSLGAVASVQPEVIKLDISLISGVHQDARKAELVKILCDYANRHEMLTVAEGIEHAEEATACLELGIKWLQGYHLGRPMPLEQLASHHQAA